MPFLLRSCALSLALAFVAGCGDQSLSNPEDLPITGYAAGQSFTLTVVMKSCRDRCSTYEAAECSASVEGQLIELDVAVPFERNSEAVCIESCGGSPVLAHCPVGALSAGTYTVQAGNFSRRITLE